MKTNIKILFVIVLFLESALTIVQAGNSKKQQIFSSSDAVNWEYIIKDASLNPQDVFKMDKGTLRISGISTGYLRTKKSYSSYKLKLEWRWTKSLGNSGVLVHIQPKDTIWPVCYQVQQLANAAGDIICMNGLWAKECTDSVKYTVKKMNVSNEKTLGEWNAMKVICNRNKITVYINGVLQNKITGLTVNNGYIGFQNEGKPMEFRNVIISKL